MIAAFPAPAQNSAEKQARDAVNFLEQAAVSLSEADGASNRIAALTTTVRAYETGLAALREGMRLAAVEDNLLRQKLGASEAELDALLALLQRVSRGAEHQVLLHPGGAVDTIRAGTLAASLIPALREKAGNIRIDLEALDDIVALQNAGIAQLNQGLTGIQTARVQLSDAVSNRRKLPKPISTDDAAIEALINSTETLSAFADGLATGDTTADKPQETWKNPAIGKILRGYNQPDAAGVRRPGWILAVPTQTLVIAPATASVRFAGEIPSQSGKIIILENKPGLLLILAGMGEVFVERGQIVLAGDALGLMGGEIAATQEKLNEFERKIGHPTSETLYIEVRQAEAARDPAEYLPRVEQ